MASYTSYSLFSHNGKRRCVIKGTLGVCMKHGAAIGSSVGKALGATVGCIVGIVATPFCFGKTNPSRMTTLAEATTAIPEFSLAGKTLQGKIVSCYDGDTFQAVLETPFGLWRFSCRMAGYDTPEMKPPKTKPNRDLEKARALKAKQALLSQLVDTVTLSITPTNPELDALVAQNRKTVSIVCKEFDKYGRLLVEVPLVSLAQINIPTVNEWMVREGYGYAYDGGTKNVEFATKVGAAPQV